MNQARRTAILTGVGVMVLTVIFLILLSFATDWQRKRHGFMLRLKFSYLNNLSEGAPVMLAGGIKIGEVEKIYQQDLQTYVRVFLSREFENRIPRKPATQFAIFSTTIAGQKYINLFLPQAEPGDEFLKEGDVYTGINPPSIDQMLLAFSSWFEGKSGEEVVTSIGERANRLLRNVNAITRENRADYLVAAKQASLVYKKFSTGIDQVRTKLRKAGKNLDDEASKNRQAYRSLLDNLNRINLNVTSLAKKLSQNQGSLKKLSTSKELTKNAKLTITNAKKFTECIRNTPIVLVTKRSCD